MLLVFAACVPPSTLPDGTVPQAGPIGSNGLVFDGTDLWLADYFGGQLLRLDATTGRVLERLNADDGIAAPDDLVIAPDGSVIYTSPQTGVVGRVRRDGSTPRVSVLAHRPIGVNPIALTPDGTAVVVGYEFSEASHIDRIELSTGAVTMVAAGVGETNGFSFGPDGVLWAPAGGAVTALTGDGAIARIDIGTGAVDTLRLSFPHDSSKRGLRFGASVRWTPDGRLLALEAVGAGVYDIDPATGVATRSSVIPADFGDNMASLPDGRTFVSNFVGGLFVVDATGAARPFPIGG